ncbi:MAG: hypothetical protein KAY66_01415, partial [Neisseria sp.]|nr:hypothetical protein [Neisseria sp.]
STARRGNEVRLFFWIGIRAGRPSETLYGFQTAFMDGCRDFQLAVLFVLPMAVLGCNVNKP